jgi:hypothetical protein
MAWHAWPASERLAPPPALPGPATLQAKFGLSQEQAEGVLGMTLRRLTSLESTKLQDEQAQLRAKWVLGAGCLCVRAGPATAAIVGPPRLPRLDTELCGCVCVLGGDIVAQGLRLATWTS